MHSIVKNIAVSTTKLDEFKRETASDENLQKFFIKEGWPDDKILIPDAVKPYLSHQDEEETVLSCQCL